MPTYQQIQATQQPVTNTVDAPLAALIATAQGNLAALNIKKNGYVTRLQNDPGDTTAQNAIQDFNGTGGLIDQATALIADLTAARAKAAADFANSSAIVNGLRNTVTATAEPPVKCPPTVACAPAGYGGGAVAGAGVGGVVVGVLIGTMMGKKK